MKKVLLLGDSIRLNYMPKVFRNLDGIAEVVGPPDNCRFVRYTIANIREWLGAYGTPDVIHWNNGIWDVHHFLDGDDRVLTTLEEYLSDLERLYNCLRKTGAKIIFATSTPCKPEYPLMKNEDIIRYNAAAVELLKDKVDEINDLFSLVYPNIENYISPDNIHLNKDGVAAVGNKVTEVLKKYL